MHFSKSFTLLGILSLAAVVTASPVPNIEVRATATDACKRKDVVIVSKLLQLSSKPQQICTNYLPTGGTKPATKGNLEVKTGRRDLDDLNKRDGDIQLDNRAFKLPSALKRYGTALITASCKCLYPTQGETTPPVTTISFSQVQGFPSDDNCVYPYYQEYQLDNQDMSDTRGAVIECQQLCRADSACNFAWLGVLTRTIVFQEYKTLLCFRDSDVFSGSKETCGGSDSGIQAIMGWNKVITTT